MTARHAKIVSSLAAVALTTACGGYSEIAIETPIRPTMDVSAFQRVFVAGFISGGSEDVDGNLETTRLLRSQLRTKSSLRVIDADSLPLQDVATEGRPAEQTPPTQVKDEKDLDAYSNLFANVEYWKRIGEEYQQPLIVTGTVMFTSQERSTSQLRAQETRDQFGRRQTETTRVYVERKAFILRPKWIFIDGRDGTVIHSETFREEVSYGANQQTPALSSYFELMDRLIPTFLSTLSSQKVKGTRFLLQ